MITRVFGLLMCSFIMLCSELSAFLAEPRCYEELQTHFFPDNVVSQALSLYNVSQGGWFEIIQQLHEKSTEIPTILHERAARMHPNPISYPFKPKEAGELLLEILSEVFDYVITNSPVFDRINPSDIPAMFAYIREQQSAKLKACLGMDFPGPPSESPQ